jgi:predicted GIY-YIG superfamily endonuclease
MRGRDFQIPAQAQGVKGEVYLLHFDAPIGNASNPLATAQHYTGWALDAQARIAHHASGRSDARIMAYLVGTAGIGFRVAQIWTEVDRFFERKLKNRGSAAKYCPICRHKVSLASAPHFGPLPAPVAALAA